MSLLGRIKKSIQSNLNGLLDKDQDPRKEVEQRILDLERDLRTGKQELIESKAAEKRLERDGLTKLAEVKHWHERAMKAVRAQDDALARQALTKKKQLEDEVRRMAKDLEEQRRHTDELEISLKQFEIKFMQLKLRRGTVASGLGQARGREDPLSTKSGAFDRFERMSDKMDEAEAAYSADAEVEEALAGGTGRMSDAEVQRRLKQLEVERLRRNMGGAGAGPVKSSATASDPLAELKKKLDKK